LSLPFSVLDDLNEGKEPHGNEHDKGCRQRILSKVGEMKHKNNNLEWF
jgi:hypothetical protein